MSRLPALRASRWADYIVRLAIIALCWTLSVFVLRDGWSILPGVLLVVYTTFDERPWRRDPQSR